MNKLQLFALSPAIITAMLLHGCSDGSGTQSAQPVPESPLEGVWSAPAYGQLVQFGRTASGYTLARFHTTQDLCLPGLRLEGITVAERDALTRSTEDPDQIEIHRAYQWSTPSTGSEGKLVAPGVVHKRLDSLPARCTESLLPIKGDPGYVFDPEKDFQIFWNTFNELYFDFTGTDWQAIRSAAEPRLAEIETVEELFQLFGEMITPLQDGHNALVLGDLSNGVFELLDSDREFESFTVSHKPDYIDTLLAEFATAAGLTLPLDETAEEEFETALYIWEEDIESTILGYAGSSVEAAADDNFIWFKTDDNIGYLFIQGMAGYGDSDFDIPTDTALVKEIFDRILVDMQDTRGLIIDLRFNEGGFDEVSLAITSYFVSDTTHVYSQQARLGNDRTELVEVFVDPVGDSQYLAPVVLLTGATTGSAAEIFTLSMRNLPNVTIVGEPTAGRFSHQTDSRVTSDIAFSVSNEFYFSPAGEWFERIGVPVDHTVAFWSQELLNQGRDPGIEKAIQLLSP